VQVHIFAIHWSATFLVLEPNFLILARRHFMGAADVTVGF